jgi:ribosomal protein S18 acetylase RimI-like enzyme
MASYRFCRPDDIGLLIEAINSCSDAQWDFEYFKQQMYEIDLWPGWCAVATHDDHAIAVVMTAKRPGHAHIQQLATHPKHQREGHASHLLNSLQQKLAILAPDTVMDATIPEDREDLREFFEKQGYTARGTYVDYHATIQGRGTTSAAGQTDAVLVTPITVPDVADLHFFQNTPTLALDRTARTLTQRSKLLRGLGIPSVEGYLAYLLYRPESHEIVGLGCDAAREALQMYKILFAALDAGDWTLPKVAASEVPYGHLETLGCRPGAQYTRYAS